MKIKKYLMLSFVFIFILLGVVNVNATEYGYGYFYSPYALIENYRFWNPRNEAEFRDMDYWVDDALVLDLNNGEITLPGSGLIKVSDGIYELNIDDSLHEVFENIHEENGNIYYGFDMTDAHNSNLANSITNSKPFNLLLDNTIVGALYKLYNVVKDNNISTIMWLLDYQYKFSQMYDFTSVNNYYETHGKMPEVIVACEYRTTGYNNYYDAMGEQISNIFSGEGTSEDALDILEQLVNMHIFKNVMSWEQITVYYVDDLLANEESGPSYNFQNIYALPYEFVSPTVATSYIPLQLARGVEYNLSNCYYFAQNKTSSLNVCYSFDDYLTTLETYSNKFGCESEEYNEKLDELDVFCQKYLENNGTAIIDENGSVVARACSEKCENFDYYTGKICGGYQDDYRCGAIGTKLAGWILRMLKIIRYIVPVLVIILSVLDFIGAIGSNNDDAMKKASQKFTKRIIAAVILFLLPIILQFLFDIFKIPGLESSNPFCMK